MIPERPSASVFSFLRGWGLRKSFPALAVAYDRLSGSAERRIVPALVHGMTLFLDPEDHGIAAPLIENGIYEPRETEVIRRFLRPGGFFVDLGANIGYFTCLGASLVGRHGVVHAFEPDRNNFSLLTRNVKENSLEQVQCHRLALSDRPTTLPFYKSLLNHGGHSTHAQEGQVAAGNVQAVALDDFLGDTTGEVDFIKLDVEGFEFHVLSGMLRTLESCCRWVVLMTEFCPMRLRSAGSDPQAFLDVLVGLGLSFWTLDGKPLEAAQIFDSCGDDGYVNLVVTAQWRRRSA